jgi:hypothetical protein
MSQPKLSPLVFLADEISETSRLTRELTAAAGHAIATLAENAGDDETRDVLHRLMIALQAQDRVEQRLTRLGQLAKTLEGGAVELAHGTICRTLHLDELITAFERHVERSSGAKTTKQPTQDDVELF